MHAPDLRYDDVRKAADQFLQKYHNDGLPIPIEEIAEQKMDIAIFAVPGIKSLLGVDAFINTDFNQITIDSECYSKFPERSRFSIAHEIGHLVMHKQFYKEIGPSTIEKYEKFYQEVDTQQYKFIEIQANTFAGLVLVPPEALISEITARLGRRPELESPEILLPYIQDLPLLFQVSDAVILRRLQREKILSTSLNFGQDH